MKHHPLGPSNFPSWEKCPRFDYAEDADKGLAIRGTGMHEILELAVKGRDRSIVENSDIDFDGKVAVNWALDFILALAGDAHIITEKRVKYSKPDYFADSKEETVYFGTADYIIPRFPGSTLDLLDFKSGYSGDHEAQLTGYALALFSAKPRLKTINCYVLYGQSQEARFFTVDRIGAHNRVNAILTERTEGALPRPTPDLCSKCAHAATCPALRGEVALAVPDAALVDVIVEDESGNAIVPVERLAAAYDIARKAEAWASAIKKAVLSLAQNGQEIPGYKLISTSGAKSVVGLNNVSAKLGVTDDILLAKADMTVGHLAKLVSASTGLSLPHAESLVSEICGDRIIVKPGYSYLKAKKE